jgi:predicted ATP-dependent serine protease
MNPETWKCPKCGEGFEAQFDACWNCGTSRDAPAERSAEETSHAEDASPEKIMSEILHLQKEQKQTLSDIQSKVGCLYIYMIIGIVVGLLVALFTLAR